MISAPRPCSAWSFATPSRDRPQRVDVEARVVSSEHRDLGRSIAICSTSARFFSPPEKPS